MAGRLDERETAGRRPVELVARLLEGTVYPPGRQVRRVALPLREALRDGRDRRDLVPHPEGSRSSFAGCSPTSRSRRPRPRATRSSETSSGASDCSEHAGPGSSSSSAPAPRDITTFGSDFEAGQADLKAYAGIEWKFLSLEG